MPETLTPPANDPVATLVFFLVVFLVVGAFFLFIHLFLGSFLRPNVPDPEKLTIYECGEPAVGSAWIQFDLRYYVVALLFVIFDVEVAFFFPWAMVFGKANQLANPNAENREQLTAQLLPSGVSRTVKREYKLATYKMEAVKEPQDRVDQDDKEKGQTDEGKKKGQNRVQAGTKSREVEQPTNIEPAAAAAWAKLAFFDILIFFGVLLVGFAYVWRRGDIDWVRTVTHRGGEHSVGQEDNPQAPG